MGVTPLTLDQAQDLVAFVKENGCSPEIAKIASVKKILSTEGAIEQIWVSQRSGHILGFLHLVLGTEGNRGAYYPKPLYRTVRTLFVTPGSRRQKIGSQLLDTVHAYALEQGSPIILADVREDDWESQQFFLHHTYEMIMRWKKQGVAWQRYKKILR